VTWIEHIIEEISEFQAKRIINRAAVLVAESEAHFHSAQRLNLGGMSNVFEEARLMGIKRSVCISSIAACGLGSSFGDRPITEDDIS
jgi:nucleoside-diphosphate-sugar epimerase